MYVSFTYTMSAYSPTFWSDRVIEILVARFLLSVSSFFVLYPSWCYLPSEGGWVVRGITCHKCLRNVNNQLDVCIFDILDTTILTGR